MYWDFGESMCWDIGENMYWDIGKNMCWYIGEKKKKYFKYTMLNTPQPNLLTYVLRYWWKIIEIIYSFKFYFSVKKKQRPNYQKLGPLSVWAYHWIQFLANLNFPSNGNNASLWSNYSKCVKVQHVCNIMNELMQTANCVGVDPVLVFFVDCLKFCIYFALIIFSVL